MAKTEISQYIELTKEDIQKLSEGGLVCVIGRGINFDIRVTISKEKEPENKK